MLSSILKKKKSPTELVKTTVSHAATVVLFSKGKEDEKKEENLEKGEKALKKSQDVVSLNVAQMKVIFLGDGGLKEPDVALANKLGEELIDSHLLVDLIVHIKLFSNFEARKDIALLLKSIIVKYLQQKTLGSEKVGEAEVLRFLKTQPEILVALVNNYNHPDVALVTGDVLKEYIKNGELCSLFFNEEHESLFFSLFVHCKSSAFDISSDAFKVFKEVLTLHPKRAAKFVLAHFDKFFQHFNDLLTSSNYVTKRESIKLLGELLSNRSNFAIMMKYIASPVNLMTIMKRLGGEKKPIQLEAFNVFKIFVANPKKNEAIEKILLQNKDRLISFLTQFEKGGQEDDGLFHDEKTILLSALERMQPKVVEAAPVVEASPAVEATPTPAAPSQASEQTADAVEQSDRFRSSTPEPSATEPAAPESTIPSSNSVTSSPPPATPAVTEPVVEAVPVPVSPKMEAVEPAPASSKNTLDQSDRYQLGSG